MKVELAKQLEIKRQVLSEQPDESQITFLGRVITWTKSGLTYEADPRHAEVVVQDLGLQNSKHAVMPGVTGHVDARDEDDRANPLEWGSEATLYRAVTARLNFLAQDRTDIQYATKEVSRWMAPPKLRDWEALRRIGKYL